MELFRGSNATRLRRSFGAGFTQPDPGASAVLIDELDAGIFEGSANRQII